MNKLRQAFLAALLTTLLFLTGENLPALAATVLGAYATVLTPLLNVRTGPGVNFGVLDTVPAGASVAVIGRLDDCSWLQVVRPAKGAGWVSSSLVQLSRPCQDLPTASATLPAAGLVNAATKLSAPAQTTASAAPVAPSTPPLAENCSGLPQESYGALTVSSPATDRPAASHADYNLALRGYRPATATAALLDLYPAGDLLAPQLTGLLSDHRQPAVNGVYQAFDWNWACNCPGDLLDEPAVSLLGLQVAAGEPIYTPDSPRTLGDGYEALVLFATNDSVTLKFTREDNVVHGYTLHVLGLCVEPQLLSLYTSLDGAGRGTLPALRGGQPFGRAQRDTLLIGIRDNGQFLEPRSLENWWRQ